MSETVRRGASQDRGERKLVTALVADLTGFTQWAVSAEDEAAETLALAVRRAETEGGWL